LLLLSVVALIVGCDRDETAIRTYAAPKDIPAPPQVASADQSPADASTSDQADQPPITWTIPKDWKQLPSGNAMRYATFAVSTDDPKAQVTVVPLPMEAAALLPNVKRWAGQLKLPNVSEADLAKYSQQTQVSGEQAVLIDMTGSADSGNPPIRLLAAIVPHGDKAWFFTLKAPEGIVSAQKANFEQFIHSIQFSSSPSIADGKSGNQAEAASYKLAEWKTPTGWQEQPGSNTMRVTSFRVGSADEHTEVIVSKIPAGGFGSIPDNLNRWRGQVGLSPVARPEPDSNESVSIGGHDSIMFSFKGTAAGSAPARTLTIVMDQEGGDYWFIKMLGPDTVVAKQIDALKQFVGSMKFEPEAR
jgi:hypothetical protein